MRGPYTGRPEILVDPLRLLLIYAAAAEDIRKRSIPPTVESRVMPPLQEATVTPEPTGDLESPAFAARTSIAMPKLRPQCVSDPVLPLEIEPFCVPLPERKAVPSARQKETSPNAGGWRGPARRHAGWTRQPQEGQFGIRASRIYRPSETLPTWRRPHGGHPKHRPCALAKFTFPPRGIG